MSCAIDETSVNKKIVSIIITSLFGIGTIMALLLIFQNLLAKPIVDGQGTEEQSGSASHLSLISRDQAYVAGQGVTFFSDSDQGGSSYDYGHDYYHATENHENDHDDVYLSTDLNQIHH
jgi:hypothetical protein